MSSPCSAAAEMAKTIYQPLLQLTTPCSEILHNEYKWVNHHLSLGTMASHQGAHAEFPGMRPCSAIHHLGSSGDITSPLWA